jgi:hypothetical protein
MKRTEKNTSIWDSSTIQLCTNWFNFAICGIHTYNACITKQKYTESITSMCMMSILFMLFEEGKHVCDKGQLMA